MAHPSPSSSSPADEKGSYRLYTGAGKQSFKNTNVEPKQQKSFWSVLAKKAKSVLLDDDSSACTTSESELGQNKDSETSQLQYAHARPPAESKQRGEAPMLQKRLVALTSSLSSLGGSIGNAIEEGLNIVEAKASDLISSDSRLLFTKKTMDSTKTSQLQDPVAKCRKEHSNVGSSFTKRDPVAKSSQQGQSFSEPLKQKRYASELMQSRQNLHVKPLQQEDSILKPLQQQQSSRVSEFSAADKEIQLKASRDVAMAMAAKAKLLLRELKEAKAELAMARDRCAQLEEENKTIRESLSSGLKLDDEDLVRIQLETLLAEKARLAQENAYFTRENQFLREMIEYHRLTMQGGGALLEEGGRESTDKPSDFNFEEMEDLPPEMIISTVIS
eukprot:c19561_g1_i1 orf=731-1894(+)